MLISRQTLAELCREAKSEGKTIVFTNGCFDIIHAGHIAYLNDSKKLGDILVIGLNSDDSVKRLKGPSRPYNNINDRAVVLSALKPVDYVSVFEEDTPLELITAILPDILTKGGDYNPDNIVGADIVRAGGGKVVVINYVEGKSTTLIIDKLKK
ncbi:MAG: D-glycero-beta-D-manno-heptose 1-phosphate adenylyltransferase [Candidatus Kapabacteria bacterium]|jgi:glycerol-3-phosphate cytidylyltransferase|nr:D-glycero-beta-D-manno-heptose 1-phosphate adenylyltransferase [Candidatus Kapabacteria bacterium]